MTESEAKSKIKHRIGVIREIAGSDSKSVEDLEIAVQVLKEIREYREIGTVEELKALKMENAELHCELQSINATMDLFEKEIRNKAIDEVAERLKYQSTFLKSMLNDTYGFVSEREIDEIAEQMKGGATDE